MTTTYIGSLYITLTNYTCSLSHNVKHCYNLRDHYINGADTLSEKPVTRLMNLMLQ